MNKLVEELNSASNLISFHKPQEELYRRTQALIFGNTIY